MMRLLIRMQYIAHDAIKQGVVGLVIGLFTVSLAVVGGVVYALVALPESRRPFIIGCTVLLVVWGWIRGCQKLISYLAHAYEARLRIAKAAEVNGRDY